MTLNSAQATHTVYQSPKHSTLDPQPLTLHSEPHTFNPTHQTPHLQSHTPNPESNILNQIKSNQQTLAFDCIAGIHALEIHHCLLHSNPDHPLEPGIAGIRILDILFISSYQPSNDSL